MAQALVKQEQCGEEDQRGLEQAFPIELPFVPQPLYCVLGYPHAEFIGVGTCGIFTGDNDIQAFRHFNKHVQQHVDKEAKRTGKPPGKPLCPKPIVTQVHRFEHAFVVHDECPDAAQSQVDGLEGRCFFAEIDGNMPIWVATNYSTDYAPWRRILFCCAPTLERARHMIYEELEGLAGEEGRPLEDIVQFDLYMLREECCACWENVAHLTNVDKPVLPENLFEFLGTTKMTDPNRCTPPPKSTEDTMSLQEQSSEASVSPSTTNTTTAKTPVGAKRKNRASATPATQENALKRADATLSFADSGVERPSNVSDNSSAILTPSASIAAIEPDNTEALLAEMHEFMKSDEKELVPTVKKPPRKSSSSSKHSSSSSSNNNKSAQEAEKKTE